MDERQLKNGTKQFFKTAIFGTQVSSYNQSQQLFNETSVSNMHRKREEKAHSTNNTTGRHDTHRRQRPTDNRQTAAAACVLVLGVRRWRSERRTSMCAGGVCMNVCAERVSDGHGCGLVCFE